MAPSSEDIQPSITPAQRPSSRTPISTNLPVPSKGNSNEDKFLGLFPHLPSLSDIIQAIEHKLKGPFWTDVCEALQRAGYPDFLPPQVVSFCESILHESTTLQHTTTSQTTKPNSITPTSRPSSSVVSSSSNTPSDCDSTPICTGPFRNTTLPTTSSTSRHQSSGRPTSPTSPSTGSPSTPSGTSTRSPVSSLSPGPSSSSGFPPPPTTDPPPSSSTPRSPVSKPPPPGDSTNPPDDNVSKTTPHIPSKTSSGVVTPTGSTVEPPVFPIQSQPLSGSTQKTASSSLSLSSVPPTSSVSISSPRATSQTSTQISIHHGSNGTSAISPSSAITPSPSSSSNRPSTSSSSFFSQTSSVVGTFTAVGVVMVAAAVGVLVLFRLRRSGKRKRYRNLQLVPQVDPDGIFQKDVANDAGKGPPMRQPSTQTNSSGRSLTSRHSTLPILPELEEIRPEDPSAMMPPPLIQSPRHSRRSWNNAPDDVDPIDPNFVWSSNDGSSDSMVSTRSTTRMTTPELLVSDPDTRAAMGWILADERGLTPVEEEDDEQALLSSRRSGR